MNKTDGLLIQSLRRLWVYRRGGELLQGCIRTERRNLRNTSGSGCYWLSFSPSAKKVDLKVRLGHGMVTMTRSES